jgi:hypothetical protein
VEAVRALERGRSLSEILDTLTSCAHSHARRVAVLLVRGDRLRGWRFDGFEPALDQTSAFEMALADGGLIARAVETGASTSGAGGTGEACPPFAEQLPLGEMLAVPLHVSGQVVAVLYADDDGSGASDPDGTAAWKIPLEIMTRHASRCLEVVTAIRTAQAMTAPSGASWPTGSKLAHRADT